MELHDHIAVFDDILSEDGCREYIDFFEDTLVNKSVFQCDDLSSLGIEYSDLPEITRNILDTGAYSDGRTQFDRSSLGRSDDSLFLNLVSPKLSGQVYDILQNCFDLYTTEYPTLRSSRISTVDVKMQRTPPGGGYHVWHDERCEWGVDHRQVVWMIYLNDMPEGEAETEFYYQKLRLNPKAGRVVLWPAAYTHVHRGNIVFSQNKYVLTGWFSTFPQ